MGIYVDMYAGADTSIDSCAWTGVLYNTLQCRSTKCQPVSIPTALNRGWRWCPGLRIWACPDCANKKGSPRPGQSTFFGFSLSSCESLTCNIVHHSYTKYLAARLNMLQNEAIKAENSVISYKKNLENLNERLRQKGLKYGPAVEPENIESL